MHSLDRRQTSFFHIEETFCIGEATCYKAATKLSKTKERRQGRSQGRRRRAPEAWTPIVPETLPESEVELMFSRFVTLERTMQNASLREDNFVNKLKNALCILFWLFVNSWGGYFF